MRNIYLLGAALLASSLVFGANQNSQTNSANNSSNNSSNAKSSGQFGKVPGGPHDRGPNGRYLSMNDDQMMTTDQKLTKQIKDKLAGGFFSKGFDQVSVDVRDSNVTLSGSVPTAADKDKIEKEIRTMKGVRSLASQIKVGPMSTTTTTTERSSTYNSH